MPITYSNTLTGRTIRCVLFDFGDTLWTRGDSTVWQHLTDASDERAFTLIQNAVSVTPPSQQDDISLGTRFHTDLNTYLHNTIRGQHGIEPDGPQAVLDVLKQWGANDVDRSLGVAVFEALRVRIPESRALFHDTQATLTELQQRGFILGVVTNRLWGGQPFLEDLRVLGFDTFFDLSKIAVSADLGIRKPAPEIFLHALHALDVPPTEAVMVGDSLRADVGGSQKLGIYSIWKPKPGKRQRQLALAQSQIYRRLNHNLLQPDSTVSTLLDLPEDAASSSDKEVLASDDDALLARPYDKYARTGEIPPAPDLTIEYLGDLLSVLKKVGPQ